MVPQRVSVTLVLVTLAASVWWVNRPADPAGPAQPQTLAPPPRDPAAGTTAPSASPAGTSPATADTDTPETISDEELSRRLVGRWETDRGGKRELIVFEDGTAHMKVTITTYHKMVFGERMEFDGEWSIQDGQLHFETTGGTPDWSVKAVTSVYGKSRVQPILKLTGDELVMKDVEEGEPNHEYRRVAD